eukprot:PhF_6_TR25517/c0_g1_i2/m.35646
MLRRSPPLGMLNKMMTIKSISSDGPPSADAPQPLNLTRTKDWVDPVESSLGKKIRGTHRVHADVPDRHFHHQWFILNSTTFPATVGPWSAEAPENSFRYRPFPEFDSKARETLESMYKQPSEYGTESMPHRDTYLSMMARRDLHNKKPSEPSLCTLMDRAVDTTLHRKELVSPLQEQRDVGRIEPVL